MEQKNSGISVFQRYLTIWVALCVVNWLIKPFSMYGIASLFFIVIFKVLITPELAAEYLAGAVLLGAAPCTAMVFVWTTLTKGNPVYIVVQVATNDLIILVAFVPIVENTFVRKFDGITTIGLLLTLILIFSLQGNVILENPLHILLIAVPLVLQTFMIFFIAYIACKLLRLPHDIAATARMIGASNFFELAVAVAVALFGTSSPAALATVVQNSKQYEKAV